MKIIIINDSLAMRRIIKNMLLRIGYNGDVLEAEDGEQALDVLSRNRVNLIITGWNMPNMDGLSFVKAIRSLSDWNDVPIIMVITEALRIDIFKALKAGVNNYIVRPFALEVFKEKIETEIGIKQI